MVGWSLVQGLYYPKFVGDYQDPLLSHLLTNSACFINGCILMCFFILSLEPREIYVREGTWAIWSYGYIYI